MKLDKQFDLERIHPDGGVQHITVRDRGGWTADLIAILGRGPTPLEVIYREVRARRQVAGRSWTEHSRATIRCHLQRHCAEAKHYKPTWTDLFRPNGRGVWRLRVGVWRLK